MNDLRKGDGEISKAPQIKIECYRNLRRLSPQIGAQPNKLFKQLTASDVFIVDAPARGS